MRFDLVTLQLVLSIAETGSISRAAEREHLALAAASKRLKDLEQRLGVRLFERRARGVDATEAGRALVGHVRRLQASLHALENDVADFGRGIQGHLRIAANAAAVAECLPPDLAAFAREHPRIRISLEDLSSTQVQAAVAEGQADVGIFAPPLRERGLRTWAYRDGSLAAVLPRGHVLAQQPRVGFDAMLDHDIVGVPRGTSLHELMLQRALEQGRSLNARLQVRGFDAIAQLVEAGLGVAVLPAGVAHRFARSLAIEVRPLAEAWAERRYLIAARDAPDLPIVVQRFVDALTRPPASSTSFTPEASPRPAAPLAPAPLAGSEP